MSLLLGQFVLLVIAPPLNKFVIAWLFIDRVLVGAVIDYKGVVYNTYLPSPKPTFTASYTKLLSVDTGFANALI